MPPIIQTFDPATAASEAVGAYAARKRANDLDAAAQAYQQKRDARRDMEADRSYGLEEGKAADDHARTASELQTDDQNRKIAAATAEYEEKMRPLELEHAKIANAAARGEIAQQAAQLQLTRLEGKMAGVDLAIKVKYGTKEAAAALSQHQAQASTAQTEAQYAPQQEQANLAQTRASTAATSASTALTQKETSLAGTSGGFGGRFGGARPSAAERQQAAYDDALSGLSEKGQQFYDMLYGSNNPPTRAQAMLALQATMRGGGGLSKTDAKNLETLIASRESQFVTPTQQLTASRASANGATRADARARIGALPPGVQQVILKMQKEGVSNAGILQAIDASPSLPDDVKRAATAALGG